MNDYIRERVVAIGNYIASTGNTVRQTAKKFSVSKSTVHKDCIERLPEINLALAKEVRQVLTTNLEQRHIRGGEATKQKFSHIYPVQTSSSSIPLSY